MNLSQLYTHIEAPTKWNPKYWWYLMRYGKPVKRHYYTIRLTGSYETSPLAQADGDPGDETR